MKRTKYFTASSKISIKVWRFKDGEIKYFSPQRHTWDFSVYSIKDLETGKNKNHREADIRITRDQARKLEPKAFR
jgi:hypothetical protein